MKCQWKLNFKTLSEFQGEGDVIEQHFVLQFYLDLYSLLVNILGLFHAICRLTPPQLMQFTFFFVLEGLSLEAFTLLY